VFEEVNSSKRHREAWSVNTERHPVSLTETRSSLGGKGRVGGDSLGYGKRRDRETERQREE
jgi:hypothetical protein